MICCALQKTEMEINISPINCMKWAASSGEQFNNILICCEHKDEKSHFKELIAEYRTDTKLDSK